MIGKVVGGTPDVFVVGGHGYLGCRVDRFVAEAGASSTVVSRDGDTRRGRASIRWTDFLDRVAQADRPFSVVWLLDGAKHDEIAHLSELTAVLSGLVHVVLVSTCTVYGDAQGRPCSEMAPRQISTPNAEIKSTCERMVGDSPASTCILRLGALYGVDERGVRADRVEKWVTQAAENGIVVVPEPRHWRGWVHRDQAARALGRGALDRTTGIFNVASANHTFGDAAGMAAEIFNATVRSDGKPDACDYQVDSAAAREAGLLDEIAGEDLRSTIRNFVSARYPHQPTESTESGALPSD